MNSKLYQLLLISVLICFSAIPNLSAQSSNNFISSSLLEIAGSTIIEDWKGISGDDFSWLNDSTDTDNWFSFENNVSNPNSLDNWEGIGWFKTSITIDETLIGIPLAVQFTENYGAAELYINGNLVDRLGSVSRFAENSISELDHFPQIIQFSDTTEHIISVRYSNHNIAGFNKIDLSGGFELTIFDYESYLNSEDQKSRTNTHIITIIAFLASLGIVHLLLLIFYPAGQRNFYFTFIAASISVFTLSLYAVDLFQTPNTLIIAAYAKELAWFFIYLCILKFSYSFLEESSPKQLLVLLIVALAVTILSVFTKISIELIRSIVSLVVLLEYLRIIAMQKFQKQPVDLLLIGILGFIILIFLNRNEFLDFWFDGFPFLNNTVAIAFLTASISFYLLRDFAKAQTKLEYKYLEVQHLSARSIDQEKRNKEKEFKQKLLEAENERKTAELEEARKLQLSMLPTTIPSSNYWDMAVKMETAYEVGGDYYDFYEISDEEFIGAVGDATGHGMKSGIIVATVKSNFYSAIGTSSLVETLKKISDGIRNLDLKMLYMGLMLFRAKKHHLNFTSAGMPQAFWYKASQNKVEEIVIKAMPLGVPVDFPYKEVNIDAQKGDVLVFLSDGIVELFNPKREQLGEEAVIEVLSKNAGKKSEVILQKLFLLKEKWSNGAPQEDDVTILVMKAV